MPEAATAPLLLRHDEGAVAVLTLNRPAQRNALSRAMLDALAQALAAVAEEEAIRCVVLTHAGPAFSAGHDLRELTAHRDDADAGRGFFDATMLACSEVMQAVVGLPQPVIAAVGGIATAAGCQLAASCDLVVASDTAWFATPGVDIGLFCSTPAVALARAVPRKFAMEMLLTGDRVTAARAREIGLVNHVVPAAALLDEAMALAQRIAARSGITLRMGKRGVNRQLGLPLAQAYDEASRVMVENLLTEDAAEGIGGFLDKRHPEWRHR